MNPKQYELDGEIVTIRVYNAMRALGAQTWDELRQFADCIKPIPRDCTIPPGETDEYGLRHIPNFGKKSIQEITEILARRGGGVKLICPHCRREFVRYTEVPCRSKAER